MEGHDVAYATDGDVAGRDRDREDMAVGVSVLGVESGRLTLPHGRDELAPLGDGAISQHVEVHDRHLLQLLGRVTVHVGEGLVHLHDATVGGQDDEPIAGAGEQIPVPSLALAQLLDGLRSRLLRLVHLPVLR